MDQEGNSKANLEPTLAKKMARCSFNVIKSNYFQEEMELWQQLLWGQAGIYSLLESQDRI